MERSLAAAFIPVAGLAGNAVVQIACVRFPRRKALLSSTYIGFAAGAALTCALEAAVPHPNGGWDLAGELAANLLIYAQLGYCYFHFINMGETARRVRLVRELWNAPDGLTLSEILSRYNAAQIVSMRLGRLLNNRQIVLQDGRYRIGRATMSQISDIILMMKRLILGRSSEFDPPVGAPSK